MQKCILKFIIIFSLIFNFSTFKVFSQNLDSLGRLLNILGQTSNKLSGEKLEKLLLENHIIIFDYYGPLRNEIELNFNSDKTYSLKGIFPHGGRAMHPSSGTWELVGLGNSYVRFNDNQNIPYSNNRARFQFLFGEDGNIYDGSEKIYSYRLENKNEKINRQAQIAEEKRIAEELRLKKIEEEKRQLAIKREQERIKQEQKQEEEKKRFQAEYELALKKDKERREEEERKELHKNILKYSLFLIGTIIIAGAVYYINKFHKDKAKNLFLNLKKYFNKEFFNKEFLNKKLNKFTTSSGLINKPLQSLNLKDFNINKSTIFQMTSFNTFKIKFKKKILKEEFFEFLNKNLENKLQWRCYALDAQVFKFYYSTSLYRYQWANNYKYAEQISNLVNKKFSNLESLTNDEIFQFKSLLSENLKDDGKIMLPYKITMWILIPIAILILWTNIYSKFISDERFLTETDYAICRAFGDPYNVLRRSNNPADWNTYDFRYGNCIKERIARSRPLK
jgi:hypothetical protein